MEKSATHTVVGADRRQHGRVTANYSIDVILFSGERAGDQIAGRAMNISKEGMGVVLRSDVKIGTQVLLTVYTDEDQSSCSGEIVWRQESGDIVRHGIKITHWSYLDPLIEHALPH